MGVAVRRYYTSPRTHDDYLESWLELWDGPPGADDAKLLPGYGWIFGMGDGTVNVGLGVLNSSRRLPEDRLPGAAHPLARHHTGGVGAARGERHRPDSGRRAADGVQPRLRTTPGVCSWSATPAARSTRSTARASRTRWSPASSPPRPWSRRWPARAARNGSAPSLLTRGDGGRMGRLLPPRRRVREAHRSARGHAGLHPARPAASGADALSCSNCSPISTTRATVIYPTGLITVLTRLTPGGALGMPHLCLTLR